MHAPPSLPVSDGFPMDFPPLLPPAGLPNPAPPLGGLFGHLFTLSRPQTNPYGPSIPGKLTPAASENLTAQTQSGHEDDSTCEGMSMAREDKDARVTTCTCIKQPSGGGWQTHAVGGPQAPSCLSFPYKRTCCPCMRNDGDTPPRPIPQWAPVPLSHALASLAPTYRPGAQAGEEDDQGRPRHEDDSSMRTAAA
ncbi:unnamed protein product [Cyclocybe aegerita]|uniref:Uncharacterized protein n=1 Tax=Cyclocybe aegerita TaxID=1973307 RepID=A0A8S0W0W6_CYCAE|nr:unnamed protein product [Cyclocybe aegerita]